METILASEHASNLLTVDENHLCLIDVKRGVVEREVLAEFPPDGRIVFAGRRQYAVIANWDKGVVCQSLADGRIIWRNSKAIHATELRLAADESSVIVSRNIPPETLLLDPDSGEICRRFKQTTDAFVDRAESGIVSMSLDSDLNIWRSNESIKVAWGVFAIFDGHFLKGDFFVSGPSGALAAYDIVNGCVRVLPKKTANSVRITPIHCNADQSALLGVVFEPDSKPCCVLMAFDRELVPLKRIAEFELVHGAAFCDSGRKLCTTSGKLFDTVSGELLAKFDWQQMRSS